MSKAIVVDSHHHVWDPAKAEYTWMTDDLAAIRRAFSADDLRPLLAESGVDATVIVQTRSSFAESLEFLALADDTDFIAGVVAWADLTDPDFARQIDRLKAARGGQYLVAIRHQVHDEPDENWLLRDDVKRGLRVLSDQQIAYDLLLRPREIPAAIRVVAEFPDLVFVLDHIAKPEIADGKMEPWLSRMQELAASDGKVWVKLSGMVTEADWQNWKTSDLKPYIDAVVNMFGPARCMFGSDWPVCLLASPYDGVKSALEQVLADLPAADQERIFGGNAIKAYGLGL